MASPLSISLSSFHKTAKSHFPSRRFFSPLPSTIRTNYPQTSSLGLSNVTLCSSKEPLDHHLSPYASCLSVVKHGVEKLKSVLPAVIIVVQISSLLPYFDGRPYSVPPAKTVLYSPDTKVPRTGELALRRAIPANANMKAIQDSLEDISYLLRIPQRKPHGTMEGNVKKALRIAVDEKEAILASIPSELKEKGSLLHASLIDGKAPGLSFLLPEQYTKYPRLSGRGTVEFTIEKVDSSTFSPQVGGEAKSAATIQVVIDGYSAPLTAGNVAKLVIDGAYDGTKLSCTSQAVLLEAKLDASNGYSVPLEIMPSGQFEPLYKTTLSVQDGELPVLPLSVYGAVAMAHSEVSEEYSSPNQFFFYLYDKRNLHDSWERDSSSDKNRRCD